MEDIANKRLKVIMHLENIIQDYEEKLSEAKNEGKEKAKEMTELRG